MKRNLLFCATTLILTAPVLADECRYERNLSLDMNASDASELRINAGAGSLEIVGVDGLDAIRAEGIACASDEELLDEMALLDRRSGDRLELSTEIPENHGSSWWGNHYARIDLRVEVPTSLYLDVRDGSGRADVRHVGSLSIVDGSGELNIDDVAGDVTVRDGSGSLDLRTISGNVTLRDGSGSIDVSDVEGMVLVEEDGSGSITIRHVGRDVTIENDGSGSIEIDNVVGDVRVGRDGSGGIDVRDVAGNFEVRSDGSGGVSYSGVRGDVRIPSDHRRK